MAAKNYRGCSTLDTAKSYISEFIKMRGRDNQSKMFDRYYVVTSEEFPRCVKEIKQINREGALNEQLKHLRPKGSLGFIETLYNAFQFITLIRNSMGIENYGYGRYPYYIDPVIFISLSDSKSIDDIPQSVKLEGRVKCDLTKEAYRWDQRLFSVVFRMSAECAPFIPGSRVEPDSASIERICNNMGGNSFQINSHREIITCVEAILQTIIFPGVHVKFVCPAIQNLRVNGEAETPEIKLKKRLEARPLTKINVKMQGAKPLTMHWPIPENYWHSRIDSVPPRSPHPTIHFAQDPVSAQMMPDFPFDKYELEPSPLVDYILERFKGSVEDKQCLQVFVHNSGKTDGFGKPFGFMKVMSTGNGVNLILMPYNYPVLVQLLQELKNDPGVKNNLEWKKRMEAYFNTVPPYYYNNLRKHLQKFRITGVPLLEEQQTQTYNNNIVKSLQAIQKAAKDELERAQGLINSIPPYWITLQSTHIELRHKIDTAKHWKSNVESLRTIDIPRKERKDRRDPRNSLPVSAEEELFQDPADLIESREPTQRTKFFVHFAANKIKPHVESTYKNPLILKKADLIQQIPRMMANLNLLLRDSNIPLLEGGRPGFQMKLHHAEELHQLPIQQMGNYEDYVKAQMELGMAPLRELEPKAVRSHAFGNPFKTDKKNMAVDEVGEGPVETNSPLQKETQKSKRGRPPRKKPGPLAVNSLCTWREKRRTISERSSVVSDLSYTSDLDMESAIEPLTEDEIVNGFSTNTNGDAEETEIVRAVDNWGLEEELEDEEEPIIKKFKPNKEANTGLDYDTLRNKKNDLVNITRNVRSDNSAVLEVQKISTGLSISDKIGLIQFTIQEARRWKRGSLCKELDKEMMLKIRTNLLSQWNLPNASFQRLFHDRSSVPRVVDDREKSSARPTDAGYVYRYHRPGADPLPRIPDCRTPVARPSYKVRDAWCDSQARFGQNDYIDLLGDGSLHPAQLQYHTPSWLRGFPGQHRANELIKLIHYRNLYGEKLKNNSPRRWHELCKRIKYLLMHHNYNKQDELQRERELGLWDEEPDYFYKDKSRRSYTDLV